MELQRRFCLLLVLFTGFVSVSQGYDFYIGGRDGWVFHPSESYNHWSGRNRFRVNDSLIFKYKKGSESVLLVDKEDFDKCNKDNPIKKMESGHSVYLIPQNYVVSIPTVCGYPCYLWNGVGYVNFLVRMMQPVPITSYNCSRMDF